MRRSPIAFVAFGWLLTACTTVSLAPGADKVRLTNDVKGLSACSPVGNVLVPVDRQDAPVAFNAANEFRNQVIGLGGNAGFVSAGSLTMPTQGVAYRCP